jgi:hypothetical protein
MISVSLHSELISFLFNFFNSRRAIIASAQTLLHINLSGWLYSARRLNGNTTWYPSSGEWTLFTQQVCDTSTWLTWVLCNILIFEPTWHHDQVPVDQLLTSEAPLPTRSTPTSFPPPPFIPSISPCKTNFIPPFTPRNEVGGLCGILGLWEEGRRRMWWGQIVWCLWFVGMIGRVELGSMLSGWFTKF